MTSEISDATWRLIGYFNQTHASSWLSYCFACFTHPSLPALPIRHSYHTHLRTQQVNCMEPSYEHIALP
ncbi:hypothetical protein EON63_16770 [archaeon]|nr:MAG: hypothetical protein EON63_16770 [archaeon]